VLPGVKRLPHATACRSRGGPSPFRPVSRDLRESTGQAIRPAAWARLGGRRPVWAANLFPFGRQYAWVDHVGGQSYAFSIGPDDVAIAEAIERALAVTRLHKRIGQCEMVS